MTHFGIFCPPAIGHLNTVLPLAQELQKRGHRLTMLSMLDAEAKTRQAGLQFQALGEAEFPWGWLAQQQAKLGQLRGKQAKEYTKHLQQQSALLLLQETPTVLKNLSIEALIVDHFEVAGGTVADYLNLPFITLCSAPHQGNYSLLEPAQQQIFDTLNEYRQRWNLPVYKSPRDYNSPLAIISQQPPGFDIPRTTRTALPPHFHFTGPYHSLIGRQQIDFPWSQLTGKPLIYASMGTVQNRLQWIFPTIATACANLDVQLVISLGGGANRESLPSLSGEPIVVEYAPQLELLSRASVAITHAGFNTTLEALSHAVPIIAIPITNDQPWIAARIVGAGVGISFKLPQLSSTNLKAAIERVLSEDKYRHQAARMQATIENAGGVHYAADVVEKAVITRQPVIS